MMRLIIKVIKQKLLKIFHYNGVILNHSHPLTKNQIAINPADARTSRFTGGERIDCAISEIDFDKRKISLSFIGN